jgi:hypothetical protein
VKEVFHTHKGYANKIARTPRTTTDSGGPRRRRPVHTRAGEDEVPRQFIRSSARDGDDHEALYEPEDEDEEPTRFATSHARDEPLHSPFQHAEDTY